MKRILIVDDTADCREPLARFARALGHQTTCAAGANEALMELEREIPDLIFLDMMMPGMDGVELLRRIRREPRWSDIPVVVLTAMMDGPMLSDSRRLGVNRILLKAQYSAQELIDVIEK